MNSNDKYLRLKAIFSLMAGFLATTALPAFGHAVQLPAPAAASCNAVFGSPINELQEDGVQVIHLGETYRLVIASSQLFNPDSANLTYCSPGILSNVARLLNAHHVISVKVAAYSDNLNPGVRKDALTAQQAATVQHYLSDHGLSARLIYADGQGDKNSVASNHTVIGRHANRRVEISFRYIPKRTIYE